MCPLILLFRVPRRVDFFRALIWALLIIFTQFPRFRQHWSRLDLDLSSSAPRAQELPEDRTHRHAETENGNPNMSGFHDKVEIEDFEFDKEKDVYHYPCPCGDRFEIAREMLEMGEDVAQCPSCSLLIRVIYNPEDFVKLETISTSKPTAETT